MLLAADSVAATVAATVATTKTFTAKGLRLKVGRLAGGVYIKEGTRAAATRPTYDVSRRSAERKNRRKSIEYI